MTRQGLDACLVVDSAPLVWLGSCTVTDVSSQLKIGASEVYVLLIENLQHAILGPISYRQIKAFRDST